MFSLAVVRSRLRSHTRSVCIAHLCSRQYGASAAPIHAHEQSNSKASSSPRPAGVTHAVVNQAELLTDVNLLSVNAALGECVAKWVPNEQDRQHVSRVGEYAGSAHAAELAQVANANKPQLCTHDRNGRRVDVVWCLLISMRSVLIAHFGLCMRKLCGTALEPSSDSN